MEDDSSNLVFGPLVIEDKIHTWLLDTGYSIRKESSPNAYWEFVAEDIHGIKLAVGQLTGREDEILIQAGITLNDGTSSRIDRLPVQERDLFLWELRFELVRMAVLFKGIEVPLKQITLIKTMYGDGLSKNAFMERVEAMRMAAFAVSWLIAKKFNQQPPKQEMGFLKS